MRVLLTRAAPEAERLSKQLGARGIDAMIEPLMIIRSRPENAQTLALLLAGAQAVLFTSANGVRAFAAATARRDLRVLAVGDATAKAARQNGFQRVDSAGGNVSDLTALVVASLKPTEGPLVQAAGSVTAGGLAERLDAAGFILRRAVLYEAVPIGGLSPTAQDALARGDIDAALFFSPRTAATFVTLAAGLEAGCASVTALALSPAVATALAALPWRRIVVAAAPNEDALLQALEQSFETERSA